MISYFKKPATPWPYIVLFMILSVSALVGGTIYYRFIVNQLISENIDQLSAISDLKVRQINQWRQERISDGIYLSSNTPYIKQFYSLLKNKNNEYLKEDMKESFKAYIDNYDYSNALFIDRNSNVILSYPEPDTVIGEHIETMLPDLFSKGEVIITDLHKTGMVSYYHLDLLVPLRNPASGDTGIFGLVILRIDPEKVLFPIIETWPLHSKSAEAILFHTEGNEIVFLSRQRHVTDGADNEVTGMRMPVSESMLPSAMALQGLRETADGIDYRGVNVLAAMKKVPSTPWYLIAKIDTEEIYTSLTGKNRQLIIIIILVILISGLLLVYFWWNQRAKYYKGKYELELERLALVKHFNYILKYANDIILLFDSNFKIVEANDRALEVYGYDRSGLLGKNIYDLRADETVKELKKDISVIEKLGYATLETFHKRRDNSVFPVEVSARKVEIEGAVYYQSISRDITERKNAEDVLLQSEERFRRVFEDSPFGMVMTGKDMVIIKVNSAFCNMLGFSEEELLGLTFKDLTHPDHISGDEVSVLRLIARKISIYHTEKRYIRKNGSVMWAYTTVNIIRNKKGEAQVLFAMVQDITERKKAEAELISAKEKAEESDRLKTAFLHNISHEIRTPMNAIMGFSSLLNEPETTEDERKQFVDVIYQNSEQLLSIINDIVDLASIESGQVRLNIQKININNELRSLSEQFRYKQKPDNIDISLKTALGDINAEIFTDKTKLIQIISNLITNALKFTEKGEISFGYSLRDGFLEFFVKDTGVGIPHEYQDRVFDRFFQVDSALSRHYSGAGLGLSICKAYIELLGGNIHLISAPDAGSEFIFTIPYKTKEE